MKWIICIENHMFLIHNSRKLLIRCKMWYCFDVSHKLDNLKSIPFPCCEHSSTSWRPWYFAILINETSFALTYFHVFDDEKNNDFSFEIIKDTSGRKEFCIYFWILQNQNRDTINTKAIFKLICKNNIKILRYLILLQLKKNIYVYLSI